MAERERTAWERVSKVEQVKRMNKTDAWIPIINVDTTTGEIDLLITNSRSRKTQSLVTYIHKPKNINLKRWNDLRRKRGEDRRCQLIYEIISILTIKMECTKFEEGRGWSSTWRLWPKIKDTSEVDWWRRIDGRREYGKFDKDVR